MKNWVMKKIISLLIATALCVSMGDFSNATASPRIISETDSLVEIDDSAFYGCKADLLTLVAPANSKAYVYAEQKQIKVATSTQKTIERKRNNGFAGETLSIKTYNNSVIPTFKSSNKSVLTVDKSGNVV